MEFDPFAHQQGSPQPGQQWSPGEQQLPPQPPQPPQWQPGQPAQWQPGQPAQWQPGQFGSQPQPPTFEQGPQWRPQVAPAMPDPGRFTSRSSFPARGCLVLIVSLIGVGGVVIAVIATTLTHVSNSLRSAIPSAPVSLAALPGQPGGPIGAATATLVVTGAPGAQVTYGPAGTDLPGSVPMRKTVALGSASTYELKVLNGSGTLKCEILVGDKVVAQATGSGGVAVCVIFRDPISGQWKNATAG
jgi:hypothetical protein